MGKTKKKTKKNKMALHKHDTVWVYRLTEKERVMKKLMNTTKANPAKDDKRSETIGKGGERRVL